MTKEPLKGKGVPAAIYKVFLCKGMSEKVDTGLLHTAFPVIVCDTAPQAVLRKLGAVFIREQVLPHQERFSTKNHADGISCMGIIRT